MLVIFPQKTLCWTNLNQEVQNQVIQNDLRLVVPIVQSAVQHGLHHSPCCKCIVYVCIHYLLDNNLTFLLCWYTMMH